MADKTITVEGHFGPKKITRDNFVAVWHDHMTELFRLSWDHGEEFTAMRRKVDEIAGQEFDRLYKVQQINDNLGESNG